MTTPETKPRLWQLRDCCPDAAENLRQSLDLHPLTARLLAARGLNDPATAGAFLDPTIRKLHDPFLMQDMQAAAERLAQAVRKGEKTAIYGDYDVDGLTATALLVRFLRALKNEPLVYLPHRLLDGYGMSNKGIDHLAAEGVRLVVTVDNGINCIEQVQHANRQGMEVVVTDHHQPGNELPPARAVVNPNRSDCAYPFKGLCGAGVAFKLAFATAKALGIPSEQARRLLFDLLDLVALGTVADVVPLLGENRAMTRVGLCSLAYSEKTGIRALCQLLGIEENRPCTCETVGFQLGPRLNAAGRTGDPQDGLELLLTEDEQRAWQLAKYLDGLNEQRRSLEREVLAEALEAIEERPELIDKPILVVAGDDWHHGVLGIVASRLVSRYGRPAICLSIENGLAKGSARSLGNVSILECLGDCAPLLENYGGHRLAAGLSLRSADLDSFREELARCATERYAPEDFLMRLEIDTCARLAELDEPFIEDVNKLRPFGQDNPSPLFMLRECQLATAPQTVGGGHLKLRLRQDGCPQPVTAIWFQPPQVRARDVFAAGPFDVAGEARLNQWNGRSSVEFTIKDVRPAQPVG